MKGLYSVLYSEHPKYVVHCSISATLCVTIPLQHQWNDPPTPVTSPDLRDLSENGCKQHHIITSIYTVTGHIEARHEQGDIYYCFIDYDRLLTSCTVMMDLFTHLIDSCPLTWTYDQSGWFCMSPHISIIRHITHHF